MVRRLKSNIISPIILLHIRVKSFVKIVFGRKPPSDHAVLVFSNYIETFNSNIPLQRKLPFLT